MWDVMVNGRFRTVHKDQIGLYSEYTQNVENNDVSYWWDNQRKNEIETNNVPRRS